MGRGAKPNMAPVLPTNVRLRPNCPFPRVVSLCTPAPVEVIPISNCELLAEPLGVSGPEMNDDTDTSQSFPLERFALGSTRTERCDAVYPGAKDGADGASPLAGADHVRFLRGFESAVTEGSHSRLSVNLDRGWVYVFAQPSNMQLTPPGLLPLEAEIPFGEIAPQGIHVVRSAPASKGQPITLTLTITTRRPARFYSKLAGKPLMRRATERDFVFSVGGSVSTPGRSVEEMKAKGFIIQEGHAGPLEVVSDNKHALPMNAWLTWQFHLTLDRTGLKRFQDKMLALRAARLKHGYDVIARTERKVRPLVVEAMVFDNVPRLLAKVEHFSVRYLIEALISNGVCVPSEVARLLDALKSTSSVDTQERALASLFGEQRHSDIPALVSERAKLLRKCRVRTEQHQAVVYRAVVSPTHLRLLLPEPEVSSDALKQSPLPSDRFLRVQFTDERGPLFVSEPILQADAARPAQGTLARIRRALNAGLTVAGRHYVFLAYSVESLADRSCWFVSETDSCNIANIRKALGFDTITDRVPAKYASKMGIPFVPSHVVPVEPNIRNFLPDIFTKEKHRSSFTQGAGRCGTGIARAAAAALGFSQDVNACPSAIQFQCGGITGVLSVWPHLNDSLNVAFRHSQVQYETSHQAIQFGLNVIRISQYRKGYLNRTILPLLRQLGVREEVLEERIRGYTSRCLGLTDRFEADRATESDRRSSERLSRFPIYELSNSGFNRNQVFLQAARVVEAKLLSDLRWDGKVEVGESVCLMGIADEEGVLEADEVFCQYVDPDDLLGGAVIVTGNCTLMRESAMQPGDVVTVKAVDQPKLRHLKNVIVFPVRGRMGRKPLPELLSGGTLGGDDYILIWDEELQPHREQPPAQFIPPRGKIVNGVKLDHIKDFFIDYLVQDVLQEVRTAHLARADRDGSGSGDCLALTVQARVAESFAYTGVPARLDPRLLPRNWPTFMSKDGVPPSTYSYDSLEILGKLYTLTGRPAILDAIDRRGALPPHRDPRLEAYTIPASVQDDAYKCKTDYDHALRSLMKLYDITEAEVVCGTILRGRPLRSSDKATEDRMYESYVAIAANARAQADRFLSKRAFKAKLTPCQIYALAAYQVTCVDTAAASPSPTVASSQAASTAHSSPSAKASAAPSTIGSEATSTTATTILGASRIPPPPPEEPLVSFPWVFWQALLELPNVHSVH